MADETKETDQNIEQTTEQQTEKAVETTESVIPDDGIKRQTPGIIDRITSILKGKKTEENSTEELSEEQTSTEDETTQTETEEYEEIDPRFVDAAHKYGWDDQRIINYAENHSDEDIVNMTIIMSDVKKDTDDNSQQTGNAELDALAELAEKDPVAKALLERLNGVESKLKQSEVEQQQAEEAKKIGLVQERAKTLHNNLDELSKEFPEFGLFKDLSRYPDGSLVPNDPALQARDQIWDAANAFMRVSQNWDSAYKNAIRWYKGGNVEKNVRKQVINDLKKSEIKVFPKRKEQTTEPVFANETERKTHLVNSALKKYGVELP